MPSIFDDFSCIISMGSATFPVYELLGLLPIRLRLVLVLGIFFVVCFVLRLYGYSYGHKVARLARATVA